MQSNKSIHWSNYWQGGQLTSLPQDFAKNYDGMILDQWHDCFKKQNSNSEVLDLCTGNCAIALLASEYSRVNNLNFKITAVDAAEINKINILNKYPNQQQNLNDIKIIANTKIENIGLPANKFNLITSQYGIEYCNWDTVAKQIYRLLKNNGEFVMLTHAGDTQIVKYMGIEKNDYELLFKIKIFDWLTKYANTKISYHALINVLTNIRKKLIKKIEQKPSVLIRSILVLTDNIYHAGEHRAKAHKQELINLSIQHKFAYDRLLDLFRVTNSIVKNPNWYKIFCDKGLILQSKTIIKYNDSVNSGTLYKFKKQLIGVNS